MITDHALYNLAIALGSFSMILIVVYHFLEVNAKQDVPGAGGSAAENPVLSEERKGDVVPVGVGK